jgi:hypothetical protein
MHITTKLTTIALLGASVAFTVPAIAGTSVAQAATPGAHAAVARTTVIPNIFVTACRPNDGAVHILMMNSIGCVAFRGTGNANDLDYANVYAITTGNWSGRIIVENGTQVSIFSFGPGENISLDINTIVLGVSID